MSFPFLFLSHPLCNNVWNSVFYYDATRYVEICLLNRNVVIVFSFIVSLSIISPLIFLEPLIFLFLIPHFFHISCYFNGVTLSCAVSVGFQKIMSSHCLLEIISNLLVTLYIFYYLCSSIYLYF